MRVPRTVFGNAGNSAARRVARVCLLSAARCLFILKVQDVQAQGSVVRADSGRVACMEGRSMKDKPVVADITQTFYDNIASQYDKFYLSGGEAAREEAVFQSRRSGRHALPAVDEAGGKT